MAKESDVLKNTMNRLPGGILYYGWERKIYVLQVLYVPVMSKKWGVPEIISIPQLPCLCPEHPPAPPALSDT
jgi:hypothetical protein